MSKVNHQELLARIGQKMGVLREERAALWERLQIVERLLVEYSELIEPAAKGDAESVGARSSARQRRKQVMLDFLKECGEAATADIIRAVQKALPDESVTRAAVTDVLRFEPEFAKADPNRRGVWRLAAPAQPRDAVQPVEAPAGVGLDDVQVGPPLRPGSTSIDSFTKTLRDAAKTHGVVMSSLATGGSVLRVSEELERATRSLRSPAMLRMLDQARITGDLLRRGSGLPTTREDPS